MDALPDAQRPGGSRKLLEAWAAHQGTFVLFLEDPPGLGKQGAVLPRRHGGDDVDVDLAEIQNLYDWLGDGLTQETIGRMLAWWADNPRDKYGRHEYDGQRFGLTDQAMATRFGAYRERFGPLLR